MRSHFACLGPSQGQLAEQALSQQAVAADASAAHPRARAAALTGSPDEGFGRCHRGGEMLDGSLIGRDCMAAEPERSVLIVV
jgi:hypothetical protein